MLFRSTAVLTVVLANYNHARFLPRALDAILSQSVRPSEVIAVDDASTDNSLEVLNHYARRDPVLRVVRNEANLGVTRNYNKGLGLASRRYVMLAAADDYLLPGFIAKSIAELEQHSEAGLCFANDSFQRGENGPVETNACGWCESPAFFTPNEVCRQLHRVIPGHAVICRREPLLKVGGLRPEIGRAHV